MEPGQLCRVVATFIEDRDGRALVRLPNGSKSSVPYGAIEGAQARAHFVASPDDSTVEVFCLDDDWSEAAPDFVRAAELLLQHTKSHGRG